jgi:DNA-binding transcriptional ArsR family regulator
MAFLGQSACRRLGAFSRSGTNDAVSIIPCMPAAHASILNHMVQYSQTRFDASFSALSDATRRGVLEQLGHADASITDLADKFHMTLTGMKKHVSVLEQAGLVTTEKIGRVRTCKKRRPGSRNTASSGPHGSTRWMMLLMN